MTFRRAVAALLVSSSAGFSTAETTAIVAATSIMSATATPHIQEYLENARSVKAIGDTRVIAISIVRLASDVHRIRAGQKISPKLLVSEGEVPQAADASTAPWTLPYDGRDAQDLAAHLVSNEAGYPTAAAGSRWRGPYMEKLSADPWGWRYGVNVALLESARGHAVIVISAGPNGIIETPYEAVGLKTGGDDIVGLIGRGR